MKSVLNFALDIGEKMLKSGGEVNRVEDSVSRIAASLGASRTDIFIITSHMTATVFDSNGISYTQTRRIKGGSTNIEKLHRLNDLSRRICGGELNLTEAHVELQKIDETANYPTPVTILAQAVIAGFFTLFFGGDLREAMWAFLIGGALRVVTILLERIKANNIFSKFLCSALSTAFALLLVKCKAVDTIDNIMIGNIMALIPGVGFTNAMRDLFMGDSISGVLRTIEAVLLALAIAAGYFSVIYVFGGGTI